MTTTASAKAILPPLPTLKDAFGFSDWEFSLRTHLKLSGLEHFINGTVAPPKESDLSKIKTGFDFGPPDLIQKAKREYQVALTKWSEDRLIVCGIMRASAESIMPRIFQCELPKARSIDPFLLFNAIENVMTLSPARAQDMLFNLSPLNFSSLVQFMTRIAQLVNVLSGGRVEVKVPGLRRCYVDGLKHFKCSGSQQKQSDLLSKLKSLPKTEEIDHRSAVVQEMFEYAHDSEC